MSGSDNNYINPVDHSEEAVSQLLNFAGSIVLRTNIYTTPDHVNPAPRMALLGQCILDTMSPEMKQALADNRMDIDVINWSGPAMTVKASLSYLDLISQNIKDKDVDSVLVFKGGNDILEGRPINEVKADLDQFVTRLKAQGVQVMLIGLEAKDIPTLAKIKNYPPGYVSDAENMFKEVAAKHNIPLYPSFFKGLKDEDFLNLRRDWTDIVNPFSGSYDPLSLEGQKQIAKVFYDAYLGVQSLHPNEKGEQIIAQNLAAWIKANADKKDNNEQPALVAEIMPPPPASALPPVLAPKGEILATDQDRPRGR